MNRVRQLWWLLLAGLALPAVAGPLAVDRVRFSAGGGASGGGSFSLMSTLGQPEAGPRLAGGTLALDTGFLTQVFATSGNQPPVVTFATANLIVLHGSGPQSLPAFAAFVPGPPSEALQTLLAYTVSNNSNALFSVPPALNNAGQLTFTPAPGAIGSATVTVIAQDNGGTANGGVDRSTNSFLLTLAGTQVAVDGSVSASPGMVVSVPVNLVGAGNENAVSFTVTFDPQALTFTSLSVPAGISPVANAAQASGGRVGVLASKQPGTVFAAGTNQLAVLNFLVAPLAPVGGTPIGFSDAVVAREVSDATAHPLPFTFFAGGAVTVSNNALAYEGDVSPRASGNGLLTVSDAVQVGRLVAGLDAVLTTGPGGEFQRADCAPRTTLGDGLLTVSDWVQTLRYAAGLDPLTPVGGPPTPSLAPQSLRLAAALKSAGGRGLQMSGGPFIAGQPGSVSVQLTGTGVEAGVGLTLGFDPAVLTFMSAVSGSGAPDASLLVNSTRAASGKLGLVLALGAGRSLAAGSLEIIRVTFLAAPGAPATASLTLNTDSPVVREVTDVNAAALPAAFNSATLPVVLPTTMRLLPPQRGPEGAVQLAFAPMDGSPATAAGLGRLEVWVSTNLAAPDWIRLTNAIEIVNGNFQLIDPGGAAAALRFYRVVETP